MVMHPYQRFHGSAACSRGLEGCLRQAPCDDVQAHRGLLSLGRVVLGEHGLLRAVLQPEGVRGHQQVGEP